MENNQKLLEQSKMKQILVRDIEEKKGEKALVKWRLQQAWKTYEPPPAETSPWNEGRCRPFCYVIHTLSISQGSLSREVLRHLWYELFTPAIGNNYALTASKKHITPVSIVASKTAPSYRASEAADPPLCISTPPTQTTTSTIPHQHS